MQALVKLLSHYLQYAILLKNLKKILKNLIRIMKKLPFLKWRLYVVCKVVFTWEWNECFKGKHLFI